MATAKCSWWYICGRRPAGLREGVNRGDTLGDALAECARLEQASILSFRQLANDLRAHGAPKKLVRRALRAARQEARHARTVASLARRRGARVTRAVVAETGSRSLEAIATENAVEGCVGETYGMLVAAWQGTHARDPQVRAAYASIAPDELEHAILARDVDTWARSKLGSSARGRVQRAKATALTRLAVRVHSRVPRELVEQGGMPNVEASVALYELMAPLPTRR